MSSASIWWEKNRKEAEKRKYESRKQQVSSIKNSVYDVSEEYVTAINGKMEKLAYSLTEGAKGLDVINTLVASITERKEKTGTGDSYLSSYDGELASEITDCTNKIDSLEAEISDLGRQYYRALAAEREAAERAARAAAEAAKRAAEAAMSSGE